MNQLPQKIVNSKGQKIELNPKALGSGGEGSVHNILGSSEYHNHVAKIYHEKERTLNRYKKINYLIDHRPDLKDGYSVIFPEEPIFAGSVDSSNFVGFIMKKAKGEVDLTSLCTLKPSMKLDANWHHKFDRVSSFGMHNRARLCYNIAAAFSQIHRTKHFVFVDIKPENIRITSDGQVSIIDLDSVQVVEDGKLLFSAEKHTGEYSPGEMGQLDFKTDTIPETWDRFSLGVIFYKLMFGLHPFTGTCREPYHNMVSNEQKIEAGLFPQGIRVQYFDVIPEPHVHFENLPKLLQRLFIRCFDGGHYNPVLRPSAYEWCQVLSAVSQDDYIPRTSTTVKK